MSALGRPAEAEEDRTAMDRFSKATEVKLQSYSEKELSLIQDPKTLKTKARAIVAAVAEPQKLTEPQTLVVSSLERMSMSETQNEKGKEGPLVRKVVRPMEEESLQVMNDMVIRNVAAAWSREGGTRQQEVKAVGMEPQKAEMPTGANVLKLSLIHI